mgnify:CR=1 FL=1
MSRYCKEIQSGKQSKPFGASAPQSIGENMNNKQKCIMRRKLDMACKSARVSGLVSDAVQHVIIEGITPAQAEKKWLGGVTNTVGRAVNKVKAELLRLEAFKAIK